MTKYIQGTKEANKLIAFIKHNQHRELIFIVDDNIAVNKAFVLEHNMRPCVTFNPKTEKLIVSEMGISIINKNSEDMVYGLFIEQIKNVLVSFTTFN